MDRSVVEVGAQIKITNPSKDFLRDIFDELTIVNPQYLKIEAMQKNTWGIPREYQLFKKVANSVIIPYGAVENPRIKKHLRGLNFKSEITKDYPIYLPNPTNMPFPHQENAVIQMLKKRRGILVAGTGAGKTNIGLYMIQRLGLRAIWITHTTDLLRQSRDRAKSLYPYIQTGTITAGKVNVGADITFATVQTLVSCVEEVKDYFNIVIVDECHHCVGSPTLLTQFYKVMNTLNAEYKFGLSATPKRVDGLEQMSFALLGEIAHTITKEETSTQIVELNYKGLYNSEYYDITEYTNSAGLVDPHQLADLLANSSARNKMIVDFTVKKLKTRDGILILTSLVAHAELLTNLLQENKVKVALLVGKVPAKRRKEILADDELQVIVATKSLAKEGLDLVRYDTLILAYSVTNKMEFTQTTGRVRRANGDQKAFAEAYEVIDTSIPYLASREKKHARWAKLI